MLVAHLACGSEPERCGNGGAVKVTELVETHGLKVKLTPFLVCGTRAQSSCQYNLRAVLTLLSLHSLNWWLLTPQLRQPKKPLGNLLTYPLVGFLGQLFLSFLTTKVLEDELRWGGGLLWCSIVNFAWELE